ncbi:hypothetical protein AB0L35_06725 [Streptomyces sp. NPDC052309]|uniref:hypothetical protein n=1 Tax=Streptomyces sp. NPDC052309 TaxID=3155421 RepID=UPI00341C473A
MPRCNKRLDPVGDHGLTRTQQAVARRWGTVLRELPRLAAAIEKEDFETIAERGEQLAHVLDYLSREARTADRALADRGRTIGHCQQADLDAWHTEKPATRRRPRRSCAGA